MESGQIKTQSGTRQNKTQSGTQQLKTQQNKKSNTMKYIIIFLIILVLVISVSVAYYYMSKKKEGSSIEELPDNNYEMPEDEEIEEHLPGEVEQMEDELDQMFDDVDSPTVTLDPLLPQFEGFSTIAKTPTDTPVDIEKGAYTSPNFKYKFKFQNDNNVVIYQSGKPAVWQTGTNHSSDSFLRLESNGNLIVTRAGETVWESGTTGGGQFLALNDQGQLAMLSEDGEIIEYIVEFHKGNANISEYILSNSDLYRSFSSVKSDGTNMNNRKNPSDSANYGWNVEGIINHYINQGREEGRTMNFITEQDDIYNEEGFQVKKMPRMTNSIFEYEGQQYSSDWIWKSEMPLEANGDIQTNYFSNSNLMSVPIEVVKFYYDYKNYNQTDVNAVFLVDCDDRVDFIFNDRYMKSGKFGPHEVSVTLKPGKNRFMCVCRNTGGPAALRAVLIDPVSKQQLMNTNLNWRYIDDLVNIMGQDPTRDGDKLKFENQSRNWEGDNQFHYDYVNETGQDQQLKIEFMFDDYGTVWIDRKLINAKAIRDTTPFYAIVPPGKSHICCEIMNYGGPGKLHGTIKDMQTGEVVLSTEDDGWRFIHKSWRPGPREFVTVYSHGTYNNNGSRSGKEKSFWIGHFNKARMTNYGIPNDIISSVRVPKMLECTIWKDDESQPKGRYSRFMTSNDDVGDKMNDQTSMVTVKTRTKDRVYFFRDSDGNNGGGGYGDTSWHIEQKGFSNFHPQLGGESFGNPGPTWNQNCEDHDACKDNLININKDKITSLWIPKGFKVRIWEDKDYSGGRKTLDVESQDRWESLKNTNMNDKNSSIKVEFGWGGTKFNIMNDYLL